MRDLESKIDPFLEFFKDRVADIKQGNFANSNDLFRKFLYVGVLDALSKTISYPKQGNRERFVSLIRNFSDWKYAECISLPHLIRILEKVHSPEFARLREYAYKNFDTWIPGSIISLEADPNIDKVEKLWPSTIPKPLEGIDIGSIQHLRLFYYYRNSLVHELRELGYGIEYASHQEPFYQSRSQSPEVSTWELVYPTRFYEVICSRVLENLKAYYLRDRIDPYSCFTFGTYWIEELNR